MEEMKDHSCSHVAQTAHFGPLQERFACVAGPVCSRLSISAGKFYSYSVSRVALLKACWSSYATLVLIYCFCRLLLILSFGWDIECLENYSLWFWKPCSWNNFCSYFFFFTFGYLLWSINMATSCSIFYYLLYLQPGIDGHSQHSSNNRSTFPNPRGVETNRSGPTSRE